MLAPRSERRLEDLADLRRPRGRARRRPRQQHGELVAAQPRHDSAARSGRRTPAHLAQRLVADGVAERVVDVLEAVDVEQRHRERLRLARARRSPGRRWTWNRRGWAGP